MPEPTIVTTPSQVEGSRAHPRRPPAHMSVSLLHSSQKRKADSLSDDNQTQTRTSQGTKQESDSPSSLKPEGGQHSSRGSSNAEKWFETSNNEVRETSNAFAQHDPPFYLRNSSSSEEQLNVAAQQFLINDTTSLPMKAGLRPLGTDGSSTEDFRGVIDDLTIENKKLKRRLKKYEKLHDSHLKDEKLFEVRIHGLPAEKKRELEETLRKFATNSNGTKRFAEFPANGYMGLGPLSHAAHKPGSSSASQQNADSAYASMSASGQGSSASGSRSKPSNTPFAPSAKSRQQNIHTYLHHIPEDLMPNSDPATMSERARKKMVVRRLEQIFAGKGAAAGGHQQALQQQDVSHMAARADRKAMIAQSHQSWQEGIREANIMEKLLDEMDASMPATDSQLAETKDAALEQRPTRPLDLDPHRAQIPADNVRYIRHLGFTLPDPSGRSPGDDQGYVYLNLLINMAQLHNINVTSDFIRKAIGEHSVKLEMSSDGRKVRWKGGRSMTKTSSHGGDSTIERADEDFNIQSPKKRVKLPGMDSDRDNRAAQRESVASARSMENNRFAYTPLFLHKDSTGDEDSSSEMEDDDGSSSAFPPIVGVESSALTSSGIRTISTKNKKKHDDGPIIFYNNARFCTDLSGDRKPTSGQGGPAYKAYSIAPIGKQQESKKVSEHKVFEKRGPLVEARDLPEPMDLSDNPIPDSFEIAFLETTSPAAGSPKEPDSASVNFEVTGIGGVYPADNFSITVQSHHAILDGAERPVSYSKVLPPRFARILRGADYADHDTRAPTAQKQVISAWRKQMRPSALPPALNYMQSDDGSDEGSDDNMSISPESPGLMPRMAAPQPLDLPISASDDSDAERDYDEGDEDDVSDDGSLDLLAAAREIDPEAVRAREREYDANMAERLAEEIPAGSSAATAGGGSGFASPASGISRATYQRAKKQVRMQTTSLERGLTSDSMATAGRSSIESEEEEQGSVLS